MFRSSSKSAAIRLILAVFASASLFAQSASTFKVAAIKGPTGIGMIELFEKAPDLGGGVSFEATAVASVDLILPKLTTGELDAAVLPVNLAAKLYNAGVPYVMAAVIGEGMVYCLSDDPSVKDFKSLKGKDIYIAGQGATPDYITRLFLDDAKVDAKKDLKLDFSLAYPEIAQMLIAGKIHTAILPEPFATIALSGNPKLRVAIDFQAAWKARGGTANYPMSVLVVRKSFFAGARPAALDAFLAAYKASIAAVVANPAEAGRLAEKHDFGMKAAVTEKAVPRINLAWIKAGDSRESVEGLLALFLKGAPASIGGKLPDDGFYAEW